MLSKFAVLVLLVCSVNVALAAKTQSKKCQQYGHSCLGGHGKRSSPQSSSFQSANLARPYLSDQLAFEDAETGMDYEDVPLTNQLVYMPESNVGGQISRMPLWFLQKVKRQRQFHTPTSNSNSNNNNNNNKNNINSPTSSINSELYPGGHSKLPVIEYDQIYPVRVKGSLEQFPMSESR